MTLILISDLIFNGHPKYALFVNLIVPMSQSDFWQRNLYRSCEQGGRAREYPSSRGWARDRTAPCLLQNIPGHPPSPQNHPNLKIVKYIKNCIPLLYKIYTTGVKNLVKKKQKGH